MIFHLLFVLSVGVYIQVLGKNRLRKFQIIKIHYFSSLSDATLMYPEKKFRASSSIVFQPVQHNSQTAATWSASTGDRLHTSHPTVDM